MNSLQDAIRGSVAAQETSLNGAERPDLLPRARKKRTVAQVLAVSLGTLGVSALVALGVGAAVLLSSGTDFSSSDAVVAQPAYQDAILLNPAGGVLSEDPASAVVVDVYLDPMCPYCGIFGREAEPLLLETEGVTVVFHPVAFLDDYSSDGSYSTRAGSAIQEVAAGAPERLTAFIEMLWLYQPDEGGGLTDAELQELARLAEVPEDIVATFPEHRYADGVAAATQDALDAGIDFVPYVTVNGELHQPEGTDWDSLFDVIEAAKAAQ